MADDFSIFGGATAQTNSAYTGVATEGLTSEKLLRLWREIEATIPPPERIDLYGHDLGGEDGYEIKRANKGERRLIVVPRNRLDFWFHSLKHAGVDVRLEPRIRETSSEPQSENPSKQ